MTENMSYNTSKLLGLRGKVMKFEQFVNEKMNVGINNDGVTLEPDLQCINACWSIIEQQSGGDVDKMLEYISKEFDIAMPSIEDLIIYVMELVDDYLNNSITITQGEQCIKHGKINKFIDAMLKIDYKLVVETLLKKLYKVDDAENHVPIYMKDLFKTLDDCLIITEK